MSNFQRLYRLALLVVLLLCIAVHPVSAQVDVTPTPTVTPTPMPASSVEEVYRLDSGSYVVIEHTFSYGELTVIASLLILSGIILRINDRGKVS